MSVPTQTMTGNLRFTRYGTVWADFILSGLSYGLRPDKDKLAIRDVHMALFRALPGESLFIGACAGLDPAAIVGQMLTGIDPEEHPDWVDECAATLDTLDQIGPGQRIFWLSVPLSSSPVRMISEQLHSMRSDLVDALALPRGPIPSELLRRATKAAARVEASVPAMLQPSPATAAQMTWLHAHMMHRGLHCDLDIPVGLSSDAAQPLWTPRGSAFVEPVLDEGGQTDRFAPTETDTEREDRPGVLSSLTRSLTTRLNPLDRRFLKVSDPSAAVEDRSSYQALLVLAGVPQAGGVFPGGELLGRIDESTLEVDWAMRLTTRSSGAVARKNQRALTNLNEQFTQRDGEVSHALNALDRIAVDLAEYVGILTSEKLEVECQPTVMFAVSGPTAESATAQAQALTDWFGSSQYKVVAPIGLQEELWWAMHPGVPTSRAVREFSQLTTSKGLASIVPLATSRLGDHSGMLLGLNITAGPMLDEQTTCGPALVTMHDLEGASDRQKSGSVAVGGELGAGKALALDTPIPTPTGWARMGDLAPGDLVFDDQGRPTQVLGTSPVMENHVCYEVAFSDGSTIVADAEHLWTTVLDRVRSKTAKANHKARRAGRATTALLDSTRTLSGPGWHEHGVTVSTEQIRDSLHSRTQANHAVPLAAPLDLPVADLPIDPYVLGAWLGDGHSIDSRIFSADPEVLVNVELAGYEVRKLSDDFAYSVSIPGDPPGTAEQRVCLHCGQDMAIQNSARLFCDSTCARAARGDRALQRVRACTVCGGDLPRRSSALRCVRCLRSSTLHGRLRLLGVLANKHIPGAYLRASQKQRRALLAGLLDTDGTVSPRGAVEYTSTSRVLTAGVYELVVSLGYRAALRHRTARLRGKDCGTVWTVSFSTTDPVFSLPRKRRALEERSARNSPARNGFRYIVAVTRVPSVPVRCIRVAAPSRLFLAGTAMVPTHNTATLMTIAGAVRDRGGRLVIVDRTTKAEWASWASSITDAVVIDPTNPTYSLDPLRLFGARSGARIASAFLTTLLNVSPTSPEGGLLSEVLDPDYLSRHKMSALGDVLGHLSSDANLRDIEGMSPGAGPRLALSMRVFARKDFGRVIFDAKLPPAPAALATVVLTREARLPSREDLEHEHLFAQLEVEKIWGRALHALIAAHARQVCFADTSELACFVVSEAHAVTMAREGEQMLIEFLRDGRKHRAVLLLDFHDPIADLGSPTLRGLIPTRLLMRLTDRTLAKRGLEWMDLDPEDESLIELITKDTSPEDKGTRSVPVHRRGEGLLRDLSGDVGRVKILLPRQAARAAAITAGGSAAARRTPGSSREPAA